ncbi:MAG: cell envelope integrity protein TolA, partial [Anaerolineales bacterium]|nr:cell envelope integrity protein TolA [Anaerolineales bacterium]
ADRKAKKEADNKAKELARRHAFSIGDYMRTDVQHLIKVLEKTFESLEQERFKLERAEEERKAREQAAAEKKAAEEKERLALKKTKAERLEKESAEAEHLAKEKAEAERLEKEKAEAERLEKEKAEAERLEKERFEAERLAKEKAEAKRLEKERAEAERLKKIRAEVEKELLAKQKEDADRKAKKEADNKAKELATAEKKAQEKRKRIAQREVRKKVQKTSAELYQPSLGTAQQVEEVVPKSSASNQLASVLKKVPIWGWGIGVVALLLIGFSAAGGFALISPEEQGLNDISQVAIESPNTPPQAAENPIPSFTPAPSSTPVPTINFSVAAASVLAYISERSPSFQDNFSTSNPSWGFDNEEFITNYELKGKVLKISNSIPENNELLLDNGMLGFSFPTNGLFDATNFWLEFDCNFVPDYQKLDEMGIVFRAAQDENTSYRIEIINTDSYWGWDLVQIESDGSLSLLANGDIDIPPEPIFNNFIFVVYDEHMLFFMNTILIYETDSIILRGDSNFFFGAGPDTTYALLDNVKFWDLEELDINP